MGWAKLTRYVKSFHVLCFPVLTPHSPWCAHFQALEVYADILRIQEKSLPQGEVDTQVAIATTHNNVGVLLEKQGRRSEAMQMLEKVLDPASFGHTAHKHHQRILSVPCTEAFGVLFCPVLSYSGYHCLFADKFAVTSGAGNAA